jgi:alpha-glucosidase
MRSIRCCWWTAALAVMAAGQAPVKIQSPGKQIEVTVAVPQSGPNAGWLTYEVSYRGKATIAASRMGLKLEGKPTLGEKVTAMESSATSGADSYELLHGKSSRVRHEWRGAALKTESGGGRLEVEARAYDDGVAFRYRIPEEVKSFAVERELTQFQAAREGTAYPLILASFRTSYEDNYVALPLSAIKPSYLVALPFTFEVPGAAWVSITEAHLENWAGMYLTRPAGRTMEAKLAPRLDRTDVAVLGEGPAQSPWRVLMISAEPYRLLESNLVTSLSPESRIGEAKWVKPGKTSWSWWSGNFAKDVSFKPGMNTETLKHYIDFSAEAGLEYTLIDAGWSGGAVGQGGGGRDITTWNQRVDVPALIEYAKSKNVKVWLWAHWTAVDAQMDQAFPLFEKWGVAGVKIDFMDRDDQQMVDFYHRAAKKAAEHKLMIDFHGAFKPCGMMRYYPNVLTHEGILGLEYLKWSNRATADHNTMIPFTRLLAGPLDYTPGGFENVPASEFEPRSVNPTVPTTRAHQMALYVLLESAFEMLADYPGAYRGTGELEFLKGVPVAWDETRGVAGRPGDFATVARRKDKTWYIGTIGASQAREVEIPLSGLLSEGRYTAEIWSDAPDAARNPKNTVKEMRTVTRATVIRARLAPAGGEVVVLRPR